jgi:hypothetical protein
MVPADFRRIALSHAGAAEGGHMGKPDFRRGKRIFATLGYPDAAHGMVKLTRDQQEMLMAAEPEVFRPANGAWGMQGSTLVSLERIDEATLRSALAMAWGNLAAP